MMKTKIASLIVCLGLLLGICTVVKPTEVKADDQVIDFGTEAEGYSPQNFEALQLITTGNNAVDAGAFVYTSDKRTSDFEFNESSPEILAHSFWTNGIKPKDGLPAGTYEEMITITNNGNIVSNTVVKFVVAAAEPVTAEENNDPGQQLVTFLDASGNTVKVEWVDYGHDATPPTGYGTYTDYINVTSHRDLKPIAAEAVQTDDGYAVPNTGVK